LGHVKDPSGCLAHCGPAAKFRQFPHSLIDGSPAARREIATRDEWGHWLQLQGAQRACTYGLCALGLLGPSPSAQFYGRAMTVWRMRIAWRIPKATNTHSEYVIIIIISFPLQKLLHEHALLLRHTHIFTYACRVRTNFHSRPIRYQCWF
jgi:hypothetical protein